MACKDKNDLPDDHQLPQRATSTAAAPGARAGDGTWVQPTPSPTTCRWPATTATCPPAWRNCPQGAIDEGRRDGRGAAATRRSASAAVRACRACPYRRPEGGCREAGKSVKCDMCARPRGRRARCPSAWRPARCAPWTSATSTSCATKYGDDARDLRSAARIPARLSPNLVLTARGRCAGERLLPASL